MTSKASHVGATAMAAPSLALGMIGNCTISALVDARACIVWSCMPRFDGDPVFNALVQPGPDGSRFAIELEDFARSEQWYEPNTAVLRTHLTDAHGNCLEVTDFCPRFFARSRAFRPVMLVRRVRPVRGHHASACWYSRATTGAWPSPPSRAAATTSAMWGATSRCG